MGYVEVLAKERMYECVGGGGGGGGWLLTNHSCGFEKNIARQKIGMK